MNGRRGWRGDARGAAMVFGIFFAVFLVACVFKLHGLAEVILYRQHQQDAADAAAFAAAVVNARGMNLIVLINLTMAAVLAVLVGLRLAQTLCIIGLSLCVALAYPTAGNSLQYVPQLGQASKNIQNGIKKVNRILPRVLSALHIAGKAVSVVIPLGSNARVLEIAVRQYDEDLGVALPGRLTLPVEDGKFIDLCRHAGALAAEVAVLPISFLGEAFMDEIGKTGTAIANAAPDWFCGKQVKSKKPDLDPGGKLDPIALPVMPRQKQCDELLARARQVDEISEALQEQVDDACGGASVEYLASLPAQNGRAREGEPLCPVDCQSRPRTTCPPADAEPCDPERAAELETYARRSGQSSLVSAGSRSPYGQRVKLAHEQCDPAAPHDYPLGGFSWVQQQVIYRYDWDPVQKKFAPNTQVDITNPKTELVRNEDEDRRPPCGEHGVVGETWGEDATKVCESEGVCSNATGTVLSSGPCERVGTQSFWQSHVRVTGILRCAELRPHKKVETPDLDMESDLNKSKSKSQNTSPFELDKEAWLGGSDFQLRSVVMGNKPADTSEKLVELARWGAQDDEVDQVLRDVPAALGRFAFGQAEYYFDTRTFSKIANQLSADDRVEWMWNQGWVARLRAFRLSYKKADGPRKKKVDYDPEQAAFRDPNQAASSEGGLGSLATTPGTEQVQKLLAGDGAP